MPDKDYREKVIWRCKCGRRFRSELAANLCLSRGHAGLVGKAGALTVAEPPSPDAAATEPMLDKVCPICGKGFRAMRGRVYCNAVCAGQAQKARVREINRRATARRRSERERSECRVCGTLYAREYNQKRCPTCIVHADGAFQEEAVRAHVRGLISAGACIFCGPGVQAIKGSPACRKHTVAK